MQSITGIVQGLRDPLGTILQLLTGVLRTSSRRPAPISTPSSAAISSPPSIPTASGHPAADGEPGDRAPQRFAGSGCRRAGRRRDRSTRHCAASSSARFTQATTLHVVIPRVMAALVMVHGSIYFIQMAVDLNNAIGGVVQSLGGPLTIDTLPWSGSMSNATVVDHPGLAGSLPRALRARRCCGGGDSRALVCHPHRDARHPRGARAPCRVVLGAAGHAALRVHVAAAVHGRGVHASGAVDHPEGRDGRWIRRAAAVSRRASSHSRCSGSSSRFRERSTRRPTSKPMPIRAVRHVQRSVHKALMPAHHVVRHRTAL